jgi:chemotaxis protein CheD
VSSQAASARWQTSDQAEGSGPRRHRDPRDGTWRVHITQGETYVTAESNEILTTVLGSCIATCVRDTASGIGGMNHFLLPEGAGRDRLEMRYGVNAMELLINGILTRGGCRDRLEAKLFGGAKVISALSDVGARNVAFAKQFLADEGIPVVGGNLGGDSARRIQFWPSSGRARQMTVACADDEMLQSELVQAREKGPTSSEQGNDVELF